MSQSNKRKLDRVVYLRVSNDEHEALQNRSQQASLSVSAFLRMQVFGDTWKPAKNSKRPSPDKVMYSKLVGELGAVGNNLNQLAKQANMGKWPGELKLEQSLEALSSIYDRLYVFLDMDKKWDDDKV